MFRWLRRRGLVDERAAEDRSNEAPELSPLEACMHLSLVDSTYLRLAEGGVPVPLDEHRLRAAPGPQGPEVSGFNVHAGVAVRAGDREGLERLCRYCARPPFSPERLSLLPDGRLAHRFSLNGDIEDTARRLPGGARHGGGGSRDPSVDEISDLGRPFRMARRTQYANAASVGLVGAAHASHEGHRDERHRPEETVLYRVVAEHWPSFRERVEAIGPLPRFVVREVEEYLRCGLLDDGFIRVACEGCGFERWVSFICKRRAFCPSCLGQRMSHSALYLTERILPEVPITLCTEVVNAFVEELLRSLRRRAKRLFGLASVDRAFTGAVTFIQRFDSALRLNVHVHTLALDGVYVREDDSMGDARVAEEAGSAERPALAAVSALTPALCTRPMEPRSWMHRFARPSRVSRPRRRTGSLRAGSEFPRSVEGHGGPPHRKHATRRGGRNPGLFVLSAHP
jgi:hypothetical protein